MTTFNLPANAIGYPIADADISTTAGIQTGKMQHAYLKESSFGLKNTDAPVSGEYDIHTANGVETVAGFHALMKDTGTAASSTFDLLKNGVSILSAVVTVANTDPDRTKKNGTIASPTLADNDVLSVKLTMTTNTGAVGPFAQVAIIAASSPT